MILKHHNVLNFFIQVQQYLSIVPFVKQHVYEDKTGMFTFIVMNCCTPKLISSLIFTGARAMTRQGQLQLTVREILLSEPPQVGSHVKNQDESGTVQLQVSSLSFLDLVIENKAKTVQTMTLPHRFEPDHSLHWPLRHTRRPPAG